MGDTTLSFNGSGLFNVNTSGQPVVAGTTITSAAFNALTADLATGLSTAICKDGQTTVTANIPLNSFKLTGLGAGTLTGDAARMSQLQSGASQLLTSLTGTDTLAATILPTLTAYATGNVFTFVAGNTNTTAVTLNIDALGAKAVTRDGSTALIAGDIVAGTTYSVMYDGTRFQLFNASSLTNPVISGSLTLSGGTANGVAYLNASKVLTTGSALTFDGTTFGVTVATPVAIQANSSAVNGVGVYLNSTQASGQKYSLLSGNAAAGSFSIKDETNNATRLTLSNAGNVTINAPSSGTALSISANGVSQNALGFVDTNGAGRTFVTGPGIGTGAVGDFGFYDSTASQLASLYTGGASGKWAWYTVGAERMRLDSSGNLLVGTTSNVGSARISVRFAGPSNDGIDILDSADGSGSQFMAFRNSAGTAIGSITRVTTTNAVTYNTTSDYRLKEFVAPVTNAGERIDALNPVEFDWKSDGSRARGFFAHEFQQVYANSVTGEKDAVDADGNPVHQVMQASTAEVIADLVAEIQSLRVRLNALENK
jgi:hypothetical protein